MVVAGVGFYAVVVADVGFYAGAILNDVVVTLIHYTNTSSYRSKRRDSLLLRPKYATSRTLNCTGYWSVLSVSSMGRL